MNNPLISIIIPVYNAEKYLRQCLDSVLSQTYTNWECLLVDDGSDDGSGHICDEYEKDDTRFMVIHKENGGVSSSRNVGIENANGEWLFFCDADDFLPVDSLHILCSLISKDVDMVMAGYCLYNEVGDMSYKCGQHIDKRITKDEALTEMYCPTDFYYQGYVWCKLMKLSIIEQYNIHFDSHIYFNEDRLFVVEYICRIKKTIAYTTMSVYNHIQRSTGTMGSLTSSYNKKFTTDFDAFVRMKEIIGSNTTNAILRNYALNGIVSSYKMNHMFMVTHHDYDSTIHKHMLKEMKRTGAFSCYIKRVIWDFLLLIYPRLVVYHHYLNASGRN